MSELPLSVAINNLRSEIEASIENSRGKRVQFSMEEIELELQIQLKTNVDAEAGVKWVVFSAGAGMSEDTTTSHRVKLKLKPSLDGSTNFKVNKESDEPE